MLSIGLDYHDKLSEIHLLDEFGKTQKVKTIHGTMDSLFKELQKVKEPFQICFEASTAYGPVYEGLCAIHNAKKVIVAHPGHIRLIFKTKRKTDRIDAKKLATLLFLDQVPQVYVPGVDVRAWRTLINHRNKVAHDRKNAKNSIRSFLKQRAIKPPRSLWTIAGLHWFETLTFELSMDTVFRDTLYMRLQTAIEMIRRVEKELNQIANKHSGVNILMTIPGVGIRTAEAVMAYIDNPKRFRRTRSIGDYFGMVPELDASAGKYRYGHITKDGPSVVRKMITEAAWQGVRRNDKLRAKFQQFQHNDPQRIRKAIVAVGHLLLRIMIAMLKKNEPWNPKLVVVR